MEIVLVGLNHRSAPVEVRERVSFSAEQALRAAEELRAQGIFHETLVLSTCNRSEVYGVPPEPARESLDALSSYLSGFHAVRSDLLRPALYHHYDRHAVRHLFRVASGLDSMMLGEAEILGQVREAYRAAHSHGATGPVLNRLFQGALEVGKRVRSETDLGTRPMSVASAGVKLAERIFGKLAERSALVLGAGTISEQVVSQLRDRCISRLYVMNRSYDRAAALAREFSGEVIAWEKWQEALALPDVIVTSVSSEEPVLLRRALEHGMAARRNRPLFVMDLGLPRNVEPAAADLYNLYLYNIDDLTNIVEQNRSARQGEVPRAEAIVEEHVAKFLTWQAGVELNAVIAALQGQLKEQRTALVRERIARMASLSPQQRAEVEALMDDLLEKILVDPARRLQGERDLRRKIQDVEAIRDLFLPERHRS
ncbi:MAG TPA: glutamyl-tRNA reductase [Dongiaceae bacterium]|nr:glutamyl-tRNA reductase [Dongiaceae bacterium]